MKQIEDKDTRTRVKKSYDGAIWLLRRVAFCPMHFRWLEFGGIPVGEPIEVRYRGDHDLLYDVVSVELMWLVLIRGKRINAFRLRSVKNPEAGYETLVVQPVFDEHI